MKEKKTLEELIQDYNECKEKYSSLVNDVEDKLIRGEYKDIELPFSNAPEVLSMFSLSMLTSKKFGFLFLILPSV